MVRKSILVYKLLKSEKAKEGYTENQIINRLKDKYGISSGVGNKRQISIALQRGLDYGILVKKTNKYRFDPDSGPKAIQKDLGKIKKRKVTKKRRMKKKSRTRSGSQVPTPTVPVLPDWTPKRRKLRDEPVSKIIKHSDTPSS